MGNLDRSVGSANPPLCLDLLQYIGIGPSPKGWWLQRVLTHDFHVLHHPEIKAILQCIICYSIMYIMLIAYELYIYVYIT